MLPSVVYSTVFFFFSHSSCPSASYRAGAIHFDAHLSLCVIFRPINYRRTRAPLLRTYLWGLVPFPRAGPGPFLRLIFLLSPVVFRQDRGSRFTVPARSRKRLPRPPLGESVGRGLSSPRDSTEQHPRHDKLACADDRSSVVDSSSQLRG